MNKLTRVAIMAAISAPSILAGTAWADTTVVQGDSTVVLPTCVDVAPTPAVPGTPAVPAVSAATHDVVVQDSPGQPFIAHVDAVAGVEGQPYVAPTEAVEGQPYIAHVDAVAEVVGQSYIAPTAEVVGQPFIAHVDAVAGVVGQPYIAHVDAVAEVSHMEQNWKKVVKGDVETKFGSFWLKTGTFGYEDWDPNQDGTDDITGTANVGDPVITQEGAHDAINGTFVSGGVTTRHHTTHYKHVADGAAFKVVDKAAIPGVPGQPFIAHVDAVAGVEGQPFIAHVDATPGQPFIAHVDAVTGVEGQPYIAHVDATPGQPFIAHVDAVVGVEGQPYVAPTTHVETIVDSAAVPGKPAVKGRHAKPGFECPTVLPHTGANSNQDWLIGGIAAALVIGGTGVTLVTRRRKSL